MKTVHEDNEKMQLLNELSADDADRKFIKFGAKLERLFEIPSLDAPGLFLAGAEVKPEIDVHVGPEVSASASGKGLNKPAAILSCLGEAAEYLSQYCRPDDELLRCRPEVTGLSEETRLILQQLAGYSETGENIELWTSVVELGDGTNVLVPANLIFRGLDVRGSPAPAVKLGLGCGAGQSYGAALLHGILELVERDAVAMWWYGGRPGAVVGSGLLSEANVKPLLDTLRENQNLRKTWLLDLTTELGVPCIGAFSCDPTGRGLACGFSAHVNPAVAIRGSILEMCQMEMAIHIVQFKRAQQGDDRLTDEDRLHLRRCYDLDANRCHAFYSNSRPVNYNENITGLDANHPVVTVDRLISELRPSGIEFFAKDLTRPETGIPVARVLASGLQPMPSKFVSSRLKNQIRETGDGYGRQYSMELF